MTPPLLTVIAPTVVDGDSVHIKGHASDDRLVRDVYVRVWNRNAKIPVKKAFYQPNRMTGDRTKMDFEADIPLWAGSNLVQVFARESNEVQSLQTVVVLKRAPDDMVAQPFEAQPSKNGPGKTFPAENQERVAASGRCSRSGPLPRLRGRVRERARPCESRRPPAPLPNPPPADGGRGIGSFWRDRRP